MLSHRLHDLLTAEEAQALGLAANQFALTEGLRPEYRDRKGRVEVTDPDGQPISLAADPNNPSSLRQHHFCEDYAWLADGCLVFWLAGIPPNTSSSSTTDNTPHPAHGMVRISRISTTDTTLFDHVGDAAHPMQLSVHGARDYRDHDTLFTRSQRQAGAGLLETHLSMEQFARLIRADNTQVSCTITRLGLSSLQFNKNPHLDHDFHKEDTAERIAADMEHERQQATALLEMLNYGVSRKAERDAVREQITHMLNGMPETTDSLRATMKETHRQAAEASRKRHDRVIRNEVAALPSGMHQHAQRLLEAGLDGRSIPAVDDDNLSS